MKFNGEALKKIQQLHIIPLREVVRIANKNNIKIYPIYGTLLGIVRHDGFIPWDDDVDVAIMENDMPKFVKALEDELDQSKFKIIHDLTAWYKNDSSKIDLVDLKTKSVSIGYTEDGQSIGLDIFRIANLKDNYNSYPTRLHTALGMRYVACDKQPGIQRFARFFLKAFGTKFYIRRSEKMIEKYTTPEPTKNQLVLIDDDTFIFSTSIFKNTKKYDFYGVKLEMPINPVPFLEAMYGDWKKTPDEKAIKDHWHYKELKD